MEEMIVVTGANKFDISRIRRRLREHQYNSIPCKTAEKLIEELEVLPTLRSLSDDLIARLSDFALDVPFLLAEQEDLQTDLTEIFEKICEYRARFRMEQNPELAEVLKDCGIEVTRS